MELRRNNAPQKIYYRQTVASEYSDRVININKLEDRTLQLNIKQLNKQERTSVGMLTREITRIKREYTRTQEKLEDLRRKQRQKDYEENMRNLALQEANKTDMDLLSVYNTSKFLSFYNISNQQATKKPKSASTFKRETTQANQSVKKTSQPRACHSSYEKSSPPVRVSTRMAITPLVSSRPTTTISQRDVSRDEANRRMPSFDANSSVASCDDSDSCTSLLDAIEQPIEKIHRENAIRDLEQQRIAKIKMTQERRRLSSSAPVRTNSIKRRLAAFMNTNDKRNKDFFT